MALPLQPVPMRLPVTALLACTVACVADPLGLLVPDAGAGAGIDIDASAGPGACATQPSTESFELVEGGFRRVLPAVTDGCVVYQTTTFVAERPASWIGYDTTMLQRRAPSPSHSTPCTPVSP